MAKIIDSKVGSRVIAQNYSVAKVLTVGLIMGVTYWALTEIINKYFILPTFCKMATGVSICNNSIAVSGDIAMILVTVFGIAIMIGFRMFQPLIVMSAVSAALWGIAKLTIGLAWQEVLLWDVGLFLIAFILFSWLSRYLKTTQVFLISLSIVIIIRLIIYNL